MNTRALAALAVPALLLAACSGDSEVAPVEENVTDFEVEEPILNRPEPIDEPAVTPTETPTPTPTPTAEPLPDEAQIQFDAEATGMTARVDRNGQPEGSPEEPVRD
ncbi:hypothetical protein [Escherichia coli]|uniref:hypothetical protein n=1 Tax=Escherichia coli TaxID=562 RepID=UPI0019095665|nr:hypothetical protein [Escherichia coli]MBK2451698.1 hypothetical protein [Escherichia coli]